MDRVIDIAITPDGFVPDSVTVRRGQRVRLVLTRKAESVCPQEFLFDEYLVWRRLSLNKPVTEHFTAGRTGTFEFQCRDSTLAGTFIVVD